MEAQKTAYVSNKTKVPKSHDAILLTLDTEINGQYLPVKAFERSVDAWNEVPLVFAQEHPDPFAYDDDAEAELSRIGGRIVGSVSGAHISMQGHPRLRGKLNITDDEVEALIESGLLSLSVGYYCNGDLLHADGVIPHHVLVFEEDGYSYPRDKGSGILNSGNKIDDFLNKMRTSLMEIIGSNKEQPKENQEEEVNMGTKEDIEAALAEVRQNHEQQVAEYKATIESMKAELDALKAEKAEAEKAKLDALWNDVKTKVPKGMMHGEGKEAELRKEFEEKPHMFMAKLAKAEILKEETPEGSEFSEQVKADMAAIDELAKATGRA